MKLPWPTPKRTWPREKTLKSELKTSSAVRPVRSAPASNMASAYSSMSTPQILASSLPACSSLGVQVGERNASVSERMADSMMPAMLAGISTPFSWKMSKMIVEVQPTGMLRKRAGAAVSIEPMRWWSMISMISARSRPLTAWLRSLWSTSTTCFLLTLIMLEELTTPQ